MKTTTRRCLLSLLGFSAAPILTACYGMPYYDEYLDMPFDGFSGKIVDVNTQEPIQNIKVHFTELLDIQVPIVTIPVRPGRNLAAIVEVAAMNNRHRRYGFNAAQELVRKVDQRADGRI